jgi:hypothetical protein
MTTPQLRWHKPDQCGSTLGEWQCACACSGSAPPPPQWAYRRGGGLARCGSRCALAAMLRASCMCCCCQIEASRLGLSGRLLCYGKSGRGRLRASFIAVGRCSLQQYAETPRETRCIVCLARLGRQPARLLGPGQAPVVWQQLRFACSATGHTRAHWRVAMKPGHALAAAA